MITNETLKALVIVLAVVQFVALLWVLIRGRGMGPVLVVNLLFGAIALIFAGPQIPREIELARMGAIDKLIEFKATLWSLFELVALIASAIAFRGGLSAKTVAWIGFAGNFALSVLAALFALTFEFKCCGYL